MKGLCLALTALVLVVATGCNDDSDGEGSGCCARGTVVLAEGTAPVLPGRYWMEIGGEAARVSVSEPGTLAARVTCSNASASLTAAFLHPGTDPVFAYRTVHGSSPLVLTVQVTSDLVDAGQDWLLFAAGDDTSAGGVSFIVLFTPD